MHGEYKVPGGKLEVFCVSNTTYEKYSSKGNAVMVHASGIHATVAGVVLGFTIPVLGPHAAAERFEDEFTVPLGARLRRVRVVRDYSMFDRREAPQFYADAKGRESVHA